MDKSLLKLINNLAPPDLFAAVRSACESKRWYFGNYSASPQSFQFWRLDLDGDPAACRLWDHAKPMCDKIVGRPLAVIRQYANGHTYGLGGGIHADDVKAGNYTLLYYPMAAWKPEWEGETVFFDAAGEVMAAVRPSPNRAVLFDSRIPHAGRPPSRGFAGLRVTVAFKLKVAPPAA